MHCIKYIKRQDSGCKQTHGCSGETSLNLSNDILDFLTYGMVSPGEQCGITFSIYKDDFIQAVSFIESQLPLFVSNSKSSKAVNITDKEVQTIRDNIHTFFGDKERINYTVNLYFRKDGRIYLNSLRQKKFSVRDYLVENSSAIKFIMDDDGLSMRILSATFENETL